VSYGIEPGPPPPLPRFDVQLHAPDIARWLAGNIGVPGFTSFSGPEPGPHVVLLALTHGNEIAGAIALDRLLASPLHVQRGRLTLGFVNLAAYARFDPDQPTVSRFVDEDMNRLWDPVVLNGSRRSVELARAREIREVVESADLLLDLHSMLWPSDPLILSGPTAKGRALSRAVGVPELVVADLGHASGRRIIDHPRFVDPASAPVGVLVEAGIGRAPRWIPCWAASPGCSATPERWRTTLPCPRRRRPPGRRGWRK